MSEKDENSNALEGAQARVPLTDIVRERPTEERPTDPVACPHCGAGNTRDGGTEETLLGWSGDGFDPNHKWNYRTCLSCNRHFIRETKSEHVWYTTDRVEARVLRGMPECFEGYTYSCAKCGGPVRRRYAELDGSPLRGGLLYHLPEGPQFRTFYRCRVCGYGGETGSR